MTIDPITEFLTLLALAADPRTSLVIGEVVHKGKHTEVARKRSDNMITLNQDVAYVMQQIARVPPSLGDPDEIVIRILRPQAE